jgi:mono/diheme cytochrome c family protein
MNRQGRTEGKGQKAEGRGFAAIVGVLAVTVAIAGCRQDMHDAPRYDPLEASSVLAGGASAQPLVDGTVARGQLNADTLLHTGMLNGEPSAVFPFAITAEDLDRGEERYTIYCAPCHDGSGTGNGMVVQRGHKQAASYHIDRLRQMPVGYFFDVMTNGFGAMADYKAQVTVEDRWRIAAYIRALQLAYNATTDDVPADARQALDSATPATAGGGSEPGGGGND